MRRTLPEFQEDLEDVLDKIEFAEDRLRTIAAAANVDVYQIVDNNGTYAMLRLLSDRVKAYHALAVIEELIRKGQ